MALRLLYREQAPLIVLRPTSTGTTARAYPSRSKRLKTSLANRSSDGISCAVRTLFTLFILVALVMGQGTSLASSICRHASIQAHEAARRSADSRKAGVASAEATAYAAASKKGSTSNASPAPVLAALLP